MAALNLLLEQKSEINYLNFGCAVNLIDRIFLTKAYSKLSIKTITSPITIREIGSNKHETSEYVITPLYFPDEDATTILTSREIHIVDNLKINLLIDINIMISEKIDILAS